MRTGRIRSVSSRRLPTREHPPAHAGRALPYGSDDTSGSRDPGRVESPPTWTCASEAVDVIAVVVGSLLVVINEGGTLASGHVGWVVWVRVALDYLIPVCVSTLGVLAGSRRKGTASQRGAR